MVYQTTFAMQAITFAIHPFSKQEISWSRLDKQYHAVCTYAACTIVSSFVINHHQHVIDTLLNLNAPLRT